MQFLKYALPEHGIKIDYPSDWEVINKAIIAPPVVAAFRRPKETVSDPFLERIGIAVIDVPSDLVSSPPNVILKEYIDKNIVDLRSRFPDFSLMESAPTTVAGNEAHQLVYIERGTKNLAVFTVKGNKVYNIVYRSRPRAYLKYLSTAEQMITSFEFLS